MLNSMRHIKIKIVFCVLLFVLLVSVSFASAVFNTHFFSVNENILNSDDSDIMDSPWPMKCHDTRHTSQSPYSTADNLSVEKWRFRSEWDGTVESSAIIDRNGTIYFGTMGTDCQLYALYPNGTKKWGYPMGTIWSTPAIAENGILYIGEWGGDTRFHAVNPDGTRRWIFHAGDSISSSPVIGDDGTIYFGCDNKYIYAINPNGTLKWKYKTEYIIISDPAIGQDGTIYIGSGDSYLYALNPNGTLKWKFKTSSDVKGAPSIADDGTIYISSINGWLYALHQNGTLKWKINGPGGPCAAIDTNGTLYSGYNNYLYAVYPNGTVKWRCDVGGWCAYSAPAISADGTIYVGNDGGKSIVAVNPDGSIKWKQKICNLHVRSSPCIGADGTVYIGSSWMDEDDGWWYGCLHAFGEGDEKHIELTRPQPGKLYFFDYELCSTPKNNTIAIGDITIGTQILSEYTVKKVEFCLNGNPRYTDYESPFEWMLDYRVGKWPVAWVTLKVVAYFEGGCIWQDEQEILYFHLRT